MKAFTSLAEARKSLIMQVGILFGIIVLICLAGRMLAKNRFNTTLILNFEKKDWQPGDLQLKWDKADAPLPDYTIGFEEEREGDEPIRATVMYLNYEPQKPGNYKLSIFDPEGNYLSADEIYVGKTGFTISKNTGNFIGDEAVFLAAILFYLGLSVIMLVFFIRLRGPLMYSYEAILALGILTFSVFSILFEAPLYFRHLRNPAFYSIWTLLSDLGAGGKYFTILSAPLAVIFSVLLIISNIALLRHESHRFQNFLGILLGILIIGGEAVFFYFYSMFFTGSREVFRRVITLENIFGVIFTYLECILFSSVVCGFRAAKHVPKMDRDYILILGCGFRKDGTLPPLLRGRVDKAMEFWHRQKDRTGKEAIIIPSGGQGKNESMAEAEAMYRYMLSTGFPKEAIILENRSANTYQNMEFSKKIIEERTGSVSEAKTAFATTNYHVFRSGVWAGLAGLPAEGLGSKTKWWFWPNAFVREFVGLLRNRIVPELTLMLVLAASFGLFTYISMSVFR
ncbi:MAG: YdcF family protein [Blautia sp.]|nr:YdcF family protein [Blautia sp.]